MKTRLCQPYAGALNSLLVMLLLALLTLPVQAAETARTIMDSVPVISDLQPLLQTDWADSSGDVDSGGTAPVYPEFGSVYEWFGDDVMSPIDENILANDLQGSLWLTNEGGQYAIDLEAERIYTVHVNVTPVGSNDAENLRISCFGLDRSIFVPTYLECAHGAELIIAAASETTGAECVSKALYALQGGKHWPYFSLNLDYVPGSAVLTTPDGEAITIADYAIQDYQAGAELARLPLGETCELTFQLASSYAYDTEHDEFMRSGGDSVRQAAVKTPEQASDTASDSSADNSRLGNAGAKVATSDDLRCGLMVFGAGGLFGALIGAVLLWWLLRQVKRDREK